MERHAPPNHHFAPGTEFSRIERMFRADRFASDGAGLGDDGFVWRPGASEAWIAASDASAEGVHYRLDWAPPARALRKALLSNLSDINAMGGTTRLALFNLGARADWNGDVFDAIGATLRELEDAFGFRVAGGDTTTLADSSFFSFTVLGTVAGAPLLRSLARPGQRIYVSGHLGGSSAGLALLRDGYPSHDRAPDEAKGAQDALVRAHLDPEPPLALGPLLSTLNRPDRPVACIDVSDGLSSELWHLARQSGCALRVHAARLPRHPALAARPWNAVRDFLLHGGEEYQLLFTGDFSEDELARLRSVCPVTEIGEVIAGDDVRLVEDGAEIPLAAGGWSHGDKDELRIGRQDAKRRPITMAGQDDAHYS
jgi:thiamine-monophosphate kinase